MMIDAAQHAQATLDRELVSNGLPTLTATASSAAVEVGISSISLKNSVRLTGVNEEHVRTLAESAGVMPPVVVHRQSMRVIDGMHRLYAAITRGDATVLVHFFDGSDEDAFLLSVRLNAEHGMPLTRAERRAAAERVVRSHPVLSDRTISSLCGVAASTVASIRRGQGGELATTARLGRDGKVRPLRLLEARTQAHQLLARKPDATVREIASVAGVSIGTAHNIRRAFSAEQDVTPAAERTRGPRLRSVPTGTHVNEQTVSRGERESVTNALEILQNDPAVRSSVTGRILLRLLSVGLHAEEDWRDLIEVLPPYCSPLAWARFATQMERLEGDN